MAEFIFTMHKVSRFYRPDKEVLKDISLSFFPGAKIGVTGRPQRLGQVVPAEERISTQSNAPRLP